VVAAVLIVGTCVLAPLAVSAVWVHRTVYDTDGYVAAVAPLADDPAIQHAVVARTVATLEHALPLRFGGGLASLVHRELETSTTRVVESQWFADQWERLNRAGHEQALTWFSGQSTNVGAEVDDDQLVVSLQPLVTRVADRVHDLDVPAIVSADRLRRLDPKVVLVDGPLVGPVQTLIRTLNDLAVVLPLLTIAGLVGAVVVAGDRRRAVARLGVGVVITMLVAIVGLRIGRQQLLDWIATTSVSVPAAKAFFDTLARGLRAALVIGLVLGVGAMLGARFAAGRGAPKREQPRSIGAFVLVYSDTFAVGLVLVGLAFLALIPTPTLLSVLIVGVAVLIGVVGLEGAARRRSV
jgi:hypothetical protein